MPASNGGNREESQFPFARKKWSVQKGQLFRKKKGKAQGSTGISGKRPPPGFFRSAEWVEQGHSGKVTPGAPPPSLPHPAGPATSVCSVCRGEGQHRGPSRTPYLGGSYLGPGAGPRGGGNVQKGHRCVPPSPALCQPYTPPHPAGQDTSVRRAVSRPERWVKHCANRRTAVVSQWVPVGSTVLRGHQDQPCAPCAVHRPCAARGASRAPGSWEGGGPCPARSSSTGPWSWPLAPRASPGCYRTRGPGHPDRP